MNESIELNRACEAIQIPSGARDVLPVGTRVRVLQSLGTSYTITTDIGQMWRIDAKNADALGLMASGMPESEPVEAILTEPMVWGQLKTIYDPEIPVNIVDLGLVYSCVITTHEHGGKKIDVRMSMTAPGCGMGNVLKADVESRLLHLPEVKEVRVEVIWDPPWNPGLMSEAAKLQLGFDLDYGQTPKLSQISR